MLVETVQACPAQIDIGVLSKRGHVTLSLNLLPYKELQQLIKDLKLETTLSGEIDQFILRRITELKGTPANKYDAASYATLKKRYDQSCVKIRNSEEKLREEGCLRDFLELTVKVLHYDRDGFSNFEEVTGKLLELAKDNPLRIQNTHLFITFMEDTRENKVLERTLTDVREKVSGLIVQENPSVSESDQVKAVVSEEPVDSEEEDDAEENESQDDGDEEDE